MPAPVCPECYHVLAEQTPLRRCPNCGAALAPSGPELIGLEPMRPQPPGGLGVAALVSGLLGCIPILPQILAIVLGWMALRPSRSGRQRSDRPLALAGILLGCIFAAFWGGGFLLIRSTATVVPAGGTAAVGAGYFTWPPPLQDEDATPAARAERKIKRLAEAIDLFRRDYRRWPDDLRELVPGYVPAHALELERYIEKSEKNRKSVPLVMYVRPDTGQHDAVVAYSPMFKEDTKGNPLDTPKRWIIRRSGTVRWVDANVADTRPAQSPDRSP